MLLLFCCKNRKLVLCTPQVFFWSDLFMRTKRQPNRDYFSYWHFVHNDVDTLTICWQIMWMNTKTIHENFNLADVCRYMTNLYNKTMQFCGFFSTSIFISECFVDTCYVSRLILIQIECIRYSYIHKHVGCTFPIWKLLNFTMTLSESDSLMI